MGYSRLHRSVLRTLERRGRAVVFERSIPGTHDPRTGGVGPPHLETVAGRAVEVPGDPRVYEDLKLVEHHPVTLVVAPETFGEEVHPGAEVEWAGERRTVRDARPVRPAGDTVAFRVVLT